MRIPPVPPALPSNPLMLLSDRAKSAALSELIQRASEGEYQHWDKVRFWEPPAPLTKEEVWAAIKFLRLSNRRNLPFADKTMQPFHFVQMGNLLRALHEIDSGARGVIAVPGATAGTEGRETYLQRSLIEEPFSSSVLEGAAATRAIARQLIEDGRQPKTIDERMVLNNYRAMEFIREHRDGLLTVERILELHAILTEGTLERPEKCGAFRSAEDDVRVVDNVSGETLHMPPAARELPRRMTQLCAFANAGTAKGEFLHPVLRAIVLHFMLSYDHPFWDGNGRCARALFYWCLLRHGYWLLEYISISSVLRRAPAKYGLAFLYTETDQGDLTYFIDHQLAVILEAMAELQKYLDRKGQELRELTRALGKLEGMLNRRQLQLIQDALKRPQARYEIAAHEKLHSVSYLTARSDLEGLAAKGLLRKSKAGVKSIFTVPKDMRARLGA
jgi:Fic family protein